MQEIKFRAWDEDLKKMFYTGFKVSYDGTVCMCNQEWLDALIDGGFTKDGFHQPKILMQCTGLKDKNGVEIYEGDILTACPNKDRAYIVTFTYGAFVLRRKDLHHSYVNIVLNENYEVIGNIHENPELLNKD